MPVSRARRSLRRSAMSLAASPVTVPNCGRAQALRGSQAGRPRLRLRVQLPPGRLSPTIAGNATGFIICAAALWQPQPLPITVVRKSLSHDCPSECFLPARASALSPAARTSPGTRGTFKFSESPIPWQVTSHHDGLGGFNSSRQAKPGAHGPGVTSETIIVTVLSSRSRLHGRPPPPPPPPPPRWQLPALHRRRSRPGRLRLTSTVPVCVWHWHPATFRRTQSESGRSPGRRPAGLT
jgi:hypothetical protein